MPLLCQRVIIRILACIILLARVWLPVHALATPRDVHRASVAVHSTSVVVAQNDTPAAALPVMVTFAEQNPAGTTIEVSDAVRNLLVLQVRLLTAAQEATIDTISIGFGGRIIDEDSNTEDLGDEVLGDVDLVDTMRVRIFADTNANGVLDPGETVLGSQSASEFVSTLTIDLSPPLNLPPDSDTVLTVTLDLNASDIAAARHVSSPQQFVSVRASGWAVVFAVLGGLLLCLGQPHRRLRQSQDLERSSGTECSSEFQAKRSVRGLLGVLLLVLTCNLTLVSCSGDDDDLTFIVNLPTNGLSNQGERLGPATAFPGATIRIVP